MSDERSNLEFFMSKRLGIAIEALNAIIERERIATHPHLIEISKDYSTGGRVAYGLCSAIAKRALEDIAREERNENGD